jgi:hypothetical protein
MGDGVSSHALVSRKMCAIAPITNRIINLFV